MELVRSCASDFHLRSDKLYITEQRVVESDIVKLICACISMLQYGNSIPCIPS